MLANHQNVTHSLSEAFGLSLLSVLVVKCGTVGLRKECVLDDQDDECMMLHIYL